MSTWVAPITWTNGAVTAATMNAEVRDHANFLKGALDLITASTTADTGTVTYIDVRRTNSTDPAFRSGVSGAANPEFQVNRNGKHSWGAGGGSAVDISLDRVSSSVLRLTSSVDPQHRVELAAVPGAEAFGVQQQVAGDTIGRARMSIRTDGYGSFSISDGTTSIARMMADALGNSYFGSTNTVAWFVGANGINFHDSFGSGTARMTIDSFGAATTRLYFNADVRAGFQRTASARVTALGRLAAVDGFADLTKAGTPGDGDYTATAETGLMTVDTTNHLAYWRVGTTWRAADLDGGITLVGPFVWTNLAASQSSLKGGWGVLGDLGAGTPAVPQPFSGHIVGISVRGSANITTGGASAAVFKAQVAGSDVTMSVTLDSTTNTLVNQATQAIGIDTFTAGQSIGMSVTTSGTFAPTTTEYSGQVFVVAHRW